MTPAEGIDDLALREYLGRMVRAEWIAWAKKRPNPKPSWLLPWEELPETDREVDRRIGDRLAREGMRLCVVDRVFMPRPLADRILTLIESVLALSGESPDGGLIRLQHQLAELLHPRASTPGAKQIQP